MKKLIAVLMIAASVAFFTSCNESAESETTTTDSLNADGSASAMATETTTGTTSYVDLSTGATVTRNESGVYVNASGEPVEFYIDMNTMDTFYGRTNQNVNNALKHEGDDWEVDEAKIKIDEDEMKVKNPDGSKIKVDGDEVKMKNADGSKTKIEDGETKIKR